MPAFFEVFYPHGVFADTAVRIRSIAYCIGDGLTVQHAGDFSVGTCGKGLSDTVHKILLCARV